MRNLETMLITGGAGFIGSALARRVTPDQMRVVALDALHPQVHKTRQWPRDYAEWAEQLTLDVTDPAAWDDVLTRHRPDVIVHLAAETGTGQSLLEASRHGRVNVVGTTEMLDGLTRHGHRPRLIILASSRAVYGEGEWTDENGQHFYPQPRGIRSLESGRWDPEAPAGRGTTVRPRPHSARTTAPNPTSIYGATKLAQEHILQSWSVARSSELAVLRFQNVYGPGQSLTNSYTGIVSLFAQVALDGRSIDVYEDGAIIRDFVFIDDIVSAVLSSINRPSAWRHPIDIGSGVPMTLLALARLIAAETSAPAPTVSGRFRPGDVRAAFADGSDARTLLGYEPGVDVAQGIRRLLSWIRRVQSEAPSHEAD